MTLEEFAAFRNDLINSLSDLEAACSEFGDNLLPSGVEDDHFQGSFDEVSEKFQEMSEKFKTFKDFIEAENSQDNDD
jgi:predicted nuclease with TOPRIM domain